MNKLRFRHVTPVAGLLFVAMLAAVAAGAGRQAPAKTDGLDARVKKFLDEHRYGWRDLNVPEADGRALHDLIVKNGYKRALEIGTSTGHSGIWIAWALAKTGGRLITIDIDEQRYREAKQNFEAAGVAPYVDARLADAHDLMPRLDGPFDFVFVDADKDWYEGGPAEADGRRIARRAQRVRAPRLA
jgi:predicted O-methyltransferase YrrM